MAVAAARPPTLEENVIVDADVHVCDTPEALAPYVDRPYRRVLEHTATVTCRYLDVPGYAPRLALDLPLPDPPRALRLVSDMHDRHALFPLSVCPSLRLGYPHVDLRHVGAEPRDQLRQHLRPRDVFAGLCGQH